MADDREARIRERAYHLWVEQGHPHGRSQEHWEEARRQIDQDEEVGVEMLQAHHEDAIGKPERGSVVEDHRYSKPPANQTDQPPPVQTEKAALTADKKPRAKAAKPATEAAKEPAATRPRNSKVKSGSMKIG